MITAAAEQLERAQRFLGAIPGAAERAMSRALNRAATSARAEAVERIGDRYAVRAADVRAMITLSTANPDRLEVTIKARSPALSIGYFPHTPTAPGTGGPGKPALRAEVLRGAEKPVDGAFIARLNSGPRVMKRTGARTASGKAAIASVYTVPLATMLGVQSVRLAVESKAIETLDKRLSHEIDRELEAVK